MRWRPEGCSWSPGCTKYYTTEENQQDFQPIIVGEGRDSVVRRSTSTDNGPYTHNELLTMQIRSPMS